MAKGGGGVVRGGGGDERWWLGKVRQRGRGLGEEQGKTEKSRLLNATIQVIVELVLRLK